MSPCMAWKRYEEIDKRGKRGRGGGERGRERGEGEGEGRGGREREEEEGEEGGARGIYIERGIATHVATCL